MHAHTSAKKQQAKMSALQDEIAVLQETLGKVLDRDADEIVKRHISLLHNYNEAKDAAQILIGRLASDRGVTIRQIHTEYNLTETD